MWFFRVCIKGMHNMNRECLKGWANDFSSTEITERTEFFKDFLRDLREAHSKSAVCSVVKPFGKPTKLDTPNMNRESSVLVDEL
jgi:hypothetical protein